MAGSLPIDEVLPRLKEVLAANPAAVLQAPPGAGKTTRVPLSLLREPWLAGQSIVMLEPRRLAATSAARFMAGQLGEKVGETVGYSIRYDTCRSRRTRIEVVTEGVLTRRLQNDPELKGIGLVVFDEFHERNLNSDLALALCHDARRGLREDLRILVMSATLDGEPIAKLLGDAPLVTSAGRSYPVDIRYRDRDPEGRPAEIAATAVRKALGETDGDMLVFLPGTGDIRHCETLLRDVEGIDVRPLYGSLSFDEQERAIVPGIRRRVVLSTNIAETSLTIEGIEVVIDSGFARQPRFEPGSGLTRLETVRISRASADQRAGRAGRLGPGVCFRLWSEGRHGSLLPFTPPEIRNADLSSVVLNLARWGVNDPEELAWIDPPPPGSVQGARQLLQWLGAMDDRGRLTRIGEAMADLPAHPRVARLLVQARGDGCGGLGCVLAALLGERDIFAHRKGTSRMSGGDLLERIEAFRREPGRVPAVQRSARYWRRFLGVEADSATVASEGQVGVLLAVGWPDRIARRRPEARNRYILSSGQGAVLASDSALAGESSLLVAVEMTGVGRGEARIRIASSLSIEDLRSLFPDRLEHTRDVFWNEKERRVVAREEERFGALVLSQRPFKATDVERLTALLTGVRDLGMECLNWSAAATMLARRIEFVRRSAPQDDWPDFSANALMAELEEWLGPFLTGVGTAAELGRIDLVEPMKARLGWKRLQMLDQLAPTHLHVPGGSRIRIDYPSEGPPVLAVKLQELFGLADTPRLANGRVPVVIHLLSPARRPLSVTQDLRNFWEQVYPEVKKEMKGRYPKHPWPDDPWHAEATRRTKKRS